MRDESYIIHTLDLNLQALHIQCPVFQGKYYNPKPSEWAKK